MVECAALEMRCTGNRTVGSNPTLSAIYLTEILILQGKLQGLSLAHARVSLEFGSIRGLPGGESPSGSAHGGGRNALRVADRAHVSVGHANNGRDALCSQPSGGQPAHFAISSALHRRIAMRSRKDRIDCRLPWRAGAWRVRIR